MSEYGRAIRHMVWLAVILFFAAVAIPIGVNIWYTNNQVEHECSALQLLTSQPVVKPANPAADKAQETTYKFYLALLFWEKSDGCG